MGKASSWAWENTKSAWRHRGETSGQRRARHRRERDRSHAAREREQARQRRIVESFWGPPVLVETPLGVSYGRAVRVAEGEIIDTGANVIAYDAARQAEATAARQADELTALRWGHTPEPDADPEDLEDDSEADDVDPRFEATYGIDPYDPSSAALVPEPEESWGWQNPEEVQPDSEESAEVVYDDALPSEDESW